MANRIKIKARRYFGFMHPILTWEHHCFAYRKDGHSSKTVSDGYEFDVSGDRVTATEKTHVVRTAYFKRHEEYPKNPLFVILEILMNIVSILRVTFGKFLIAGIFIATILEAEGLVMNYLIPALTAIYALSFIIPLGGFIVRNVFGLDQRMDDICEENGWMKWSEYQDE